MPHLTSLSLAGTQAFFEIQARLRVSGLPVPLELSSSPWFAASDRDDYLLPFLCRWLVWHGPRHHPLAFPRPSSLPKEAR